MQYKLTDSPLVRLDHGAIARMAHEALRTYCLLVYDSPAATWADAPAPVRQQMCDLVRRLSEHPGETPEQFHSNWMAPLVADGWKHGDRRDNIHKTHPHLVAFADLSPKYRSKQAMLFALIGHLLDPSKLSTGC